MLRRLLQLGLIAGLLAGTRAHAAPDDAPLRLRVLTFNAWGIWMITPAREARMAAIGPAIAALDPDVVAMQEVWVDADAEALAHALAEAGLPHHQRFFSTWPGDSGLFIASRFPIERTDFIEYSAGTHPDIPWHVDWLAGKGLGRVRLQTPAGPVDVANTHVQAGYGSGRYALIQLAQLMEAADFLEQDGDAPLVVAGDLNVPCDSLPYRAFARRLALRPMRSTCGIDSISTRSGGGRALEVMDVQDVLTSPVALADGSTQRLSDHPGVLVELALQPAAEAQARLSPAPAWLDVAREALGQIYAQRTALSRAQVRDAVLALGLLQAGLLFFVARRRWRGASWLARHPLAALGAAAVVAALWFGYLGASYAPKHLTELNRVRQRLETALAAGMLRGP